MPPREWEYRIRDIRNAAEKIVRHTQPMDYETFVKDDWAGDAVLHNFSIIGEASRHIPEDICSRHPRIPWREMQDMRNLVIHEYFGIDWSIVWKTIQDDLPDLIRLLDESFGMC
jgi:hypothetical protein